MKKLFVFMILVITIIGVVSMTVLGADLTAEEEVAQQLLTLKALAVNLAVSFLGTSTFAMILRIALSKVIKRAEAGVKQAEEEGKITSENATKIYTTLQNFETHIDNKISLFEQRLQTLGEQMGVSNENVTQLITDFRARDERIALLMAQELGESDGEE